ncbi:TatD family nuclease-associated radical SAM protein [Natroniella sulfidigena]|uniref:TatD family nuclease-associated radical SAM protein n=1 Tax=Natroniella sulfidigena TaxID=723921 RepID=UPI00200B22BA|nr:TatD family nuclease-associated radical SAM protein [Natroniella sulfidigena]MCK8817079.1 TatD family nuclease-associated radical SAM protein [Natroniella sulfidigena]
MTIAYQIGDRLYLNLTNQCSNDCKFCIRRFQAGVGGYELWFDQEPTVEEIIAELNKEDIDHYQEVVYCGYGEPLIRVDVLVETSKFLKENYPEVKIRLNTNGQANLIHQENIAPRLEGLIDIISISLNTADARSYQELCESEFGEEAFVGIIEFIKESKKFIPKVIVSVVDQAGVDVAAARKIAEELEVEFRVRSFSEDE